MNNKFFKLNREMLWTMIDNHQLLQSDNGTNLFKKIDLYGTPDEEAYLTYYNLTNVHKLKVITWEMFDRKVFRRGK